MGFPDEEKYKYGDYTHTSRDGRFKFEWTPFTPAVVAWGNAAGHLRRAHWHLTEAKKLNSFALNGLGGEHDRYRESLEEYIAHTLESAEEADRVEQLLEVANKEYAATAEASAEEYSNIRKTIDLVTTGQSGVRNVEDTTEAATEKQKDVDAGFPFDGRAK
jgi:hypothetical protein